MLPSQPASPGRGRGDRAVARAQHFRGARGRLRSPALAACHTGYQGKRAGRGHGLGEGALPRWGDGREASQHEGTVSADRVQSRSTPLSTGRFLQPAPDAVVGRAIQSSTADCGMPLPRMCRMRGTPQGAGQRSLSGLPKALRQWKKTRLLKWTVNASAARMIPTLPRLALGRDSTVHNRSARRMYHEGGRRHRHRYARN